MRIFCSVFFVFLLPWVAKSHLVAGCGIYSDDFTLLQNFPGWQCLFLEDGTWVSTEKSKVTRFSAMGDVLWQQKLATHHVVSLSEDKTEILTMGRESLPMIGHCAVRNDTFTILNVKNGKIERHFSFAPYWEKIDTLFPGTGYLYPISSADLRTYDCEYEYSHFNSFYEIPPNSYERIDPAFRAGNYVANSHGFPYLIIFDHELKKIVKKIESRQLGLVYAHDVQILPSGKVLFYRENESFNLISPMLSISLLDLKTLKREVLYPKLKKDFSISLGGWPLSSFQVLERSEYLTAALYGGSIQILGDGYLVSQNDPTKGGFLIKLDKDWKIVWRKPNSYESKPGKPANFSYVKSRDLTRFLSKNRAQ